MINLSKKGTIDFGLLFNNSPNPYVILSPDLKLVGMNEAYLKVTMRERGDLIGRTMFEAFPGTPNEQGQANAAQLRSSFERVLAKGETDHLPLILYPLLMPDGTFEKRYWSATHTPVFDKEGKVAFILQHTVDVTELHNLRQAARITAPISDAAVHVEGDILKRAQAVQQVNDALTEERQHLRRLFEQTPGFTAVLGGPEHVFEMVNPAYSLLVGRSDIIGKPIRDALPEVESQGFIALLDQVYATAQPYVGKNTRIFLHQDPALPPTEHILDFVYQPILQANGSVAGILVQGNDITDQRRTESELQEYREHLEALVLKRTQELEESEAQRRQAQKMEAIGQLTGGVAHDFNNLLAIVIGNVELARKRIADPRVDRLLANALQAGERGAKLTRQLLAFARKQSLSLEPTDLVQTILGMRDLLARTIGPGILIRTQLPADLWPVVTDRNQLEVAILNIAINARDAMPSGGSLVIAAANIRPENLMPDLAPNDYVRISFKDTGTGIPVEIRSKVFEPFFTTKEVGKGTGLGLSQIYGFVKQQGGGVALSSEQGQGTEITLYLPRTQEQPRIDILDPEEFGATAEGTRILVVDDDEGVRSFVSESLQDMGYRVTEAGNGEQGLAALREDPDVAMAVVDFAMPVLDGMSFVETVRKDSPDLPVILMTGYADVERLADMRLANVPLIAKPFGIDTLLRMIRQELKDQELKDQELENEA